MFARPAALFCTLPSPAGAMYASILSEVYLDGYTSFSSNLAEYGGKKGSKTGASGRKPLQRMCQSDDLDWCTP